MKKSILTALLLTFLITSVSWAQTEGVLTVSTSTSETGGNYAPRNIVAIWIENESGDFVKTLLAYAQNRKTHLNTWQASTTAAGSEYNTVDAITGATKNSHNTRTCSWNGTDIDGNTVADGSYTLWMELTDKNGTGNFSSFSFNKGEIPDIQTPSDVPSFSSISINWQPTTTDFIDYQTSEDYTIYPNPNTGVFLVQGQNVSSIEIFSTSGQLVYSNSKQDVNIGLHPNGIYLVKIKTAKGSVVKKILKQ